MNVKWVVLGIEYLVLRRGGNDFEQANNKTLEQLNKNSIEYLDEWLRFCVGRTDF